MTWHETASGHAGSAANGAIGYVSTRSPNAAPVSFEQALLAGLAPDGGLFLPTEFPSLDPAWRTAGSVAELAAVALPRLLGLSAAEVERTFASAIDFPLEIRALPGERYVLELFHGPTAAFKDVGARSMARLLERSLAASGRSALVLVATSGDTGSAVAAAFAGLERLRVALLYPLGMVSAVQERQLLAPRDGVSAFAVEGTFDDCQRLVKEALDDPALRGLGLSSANSINVARLLPQVLYHLWGLKRAGELGAPTATLSVVVPSGNLGNLTSGVLASLMGSGARDFVAAHNVNDYYPRYLAGDAPAFAFQETRATASNAMDVGAPSNFERLVALENAAGASPARIEGVSVSDAETLTQLRETYVDDGYLVCPHTSVGLRAWQRLVAAGERTGPALLLATAHPGKFPEIVASALGEVVPGAALPGGEPPAPGLATRLEPSLSALRAALLELPD